MRDRLHKISAQRCKDWRGTLIAFNGEADHVQLLISLPPNLEPSAFVNNLKTTSSRLVRRDFADQLNRVYRGKPMFWSRSCCIISCGGAPLSILKQYIEQQKAPDQFALRATRASPPAWRCRAEGGALPAKIR